MKIPEGNFTLTALIDKAHEDRQEPPRGHMGCSLLGHPCERYLWLSFRWAFYPQFPGRILRLFRRGQLEEATIVQDLRDIGCNVVAEENGNQIRVDFGKHVSGSVDAIILGGLPSAEKKEHVVEMKTHSLKSFKDLEKQGVEKSKPQHYAQMQVYMKGLGIDRALYYAVCKDNDSIYTERVIYDPEFAQKMVDKGQRIAMSHRIPPPVLGASASWYQCKFCDAYDLCWSNKECEANCRTCAHSVPMATSEWGCSEWDDLIPSDAQLKGCDKYEKHIELVNIC